MQTNLELDRAVSVVAATLNALNLAEWSAERVQEALDDALGTESPMWVDDAGALHNASGACLGEVRRTARGMWIIRRKG
jgi:hypothetical protein